MVRLALRPVEERVVVPVLARARSMRRTCRRAGGGKRHDEREHRRKSPHLRYFLILKFALAGLLGPETSVATAISL